MSNKISLYRDLCEIEMSIPLFSKSWWLDSVTDKHGWDVALVEENGLIVASMPYVVKKKFGFTIITQPQLTQTLGPWLRLDGESYAKKMSLQKRRIQALFAQLPKYDYFQQNWHHTITNWLPVYWLGFKQSTNYTYVLTGISDIDKTFSRFDSAYRNKIRKASSIVKVKKELSIEMFYELNKQTFSRQKIKIPYSFEFLKKHDAILAAKNKRTIFYAEDSQGKIHSALYLTWDSVSAYVHMVGEDPELRNSGAGIYLIWEAIKYSTEVLGLECFDFEGSMLEGVEPVRRSCGGVQVPYFNISRIPSVIMKTLYFIKELRQ
jgi:hypothetical protein